MVYAYWCETKDGQTINFMDTEYHDLGETLTYKGIECTVVDMAIEYPITAAEMAETYEDSKNW